MVIHNFNHRVLLRSRKIYHFHDLFVFCKFFYICNYHKCIHHNRQREVLRRSDNYSGNFYIQSLENNLLQRLLVGLTIHFQINLLIIFFFLNFVKEIISIFCFPFTSIFYIPFRCLHFPIRNFVLNCKRWYVPN